MDAKKDDKSILEKTVDVVKEFAASVSAAAHKAVKPNHKNSAEEVVMVPSAPTDLLDDAVAPPVILEQKQESSHRTKTKTKRQKSRKSSQGANSSAHRKSVSKKTSSSKKRYTRKARR